MIFNYIVLALIPCQIWLYFLQSFSLYVCAFNCKGWVWEISEESSFKNWSSEFCDWLLIVSREATHEKSRVEDMTGRWRVMPGCIFCNCLAGKANLWWTRESFCLAKSCVLLYQVFTNTIYTLIAHKL